MSVRRHVAILAVLTLVGCTIVPQSPGLGRHLICEIRVHNGGELRCPQRFRCRRVPDTTYCYYVADRT
jgi:radical SAM superfamily enzyme with C-terminal helix-hairpin-helix motif